MAADKLLLLITGANTGLGYYAAQQLLASGKYHVLLGSRNIDKANAAIESLRTDTSMPINVNDVEPIVIDLGSDDSIIAAARHVEAKFGLLDILMNNAGISKAIGVHSDSEPNPDGSGPGSRDQYRQIYDTNVFGTVVATEAFIPLLRKSTKPGGKRIAFTGSSLGSLEIAIDPPNPQAAAKNYAIYRSSKTALNMVMAGFASMLEGEGFVVGASCPGYCATSLNGFRGYKDPKEGAEMLVKVAEADKKEVHSKLTQDTGPVPW